jgi:hypothetical protein
VTKAARLLLAVAGVALCVAGLAGCSRTGSAEPARSHVTVRAKDFKLTVSQPWWPAGKLSVRFVNDGPETHELLLFAAPGNSADAMPMRPDGDTVDEDSPLLRSLIDEPGTPPGGSKTVTVDLAPGHYVVLCNMSGHYMAGMWQDVTVG